VFNFLRDKIETFLDYLGDSLVDFDLEFFDDEV
jgi:hypothetical protein